MIRKTALPLPWKVRSLPSTSIGLRPEMLSPQVQPAPYMARCVHSRVMTPPEPPFYMAVMAAALEPFS